jgi:NAD(P)-dependent dehydrogenase (short-subunit alcohol dehydrogenase family)
MVADYLTKMYGLQGQTAVVIGGAGVLGGALCRGLTQAGAHVIVADLIEEICQKRVEELQQLGGQAGYVLVNVTSRESIESLLANR